MNKSKGLEIGTCLAILKTSKATVATETETAIDKVSDDPMLFQTNGQISILIFLKLSGGYAIADHFLTFIVFFGHHSLLVFLLLYWPLLFSFADSSLISELGLLM